MFAMTNSIVITVWVLNRLRPFLVRFAPHMLDTLLVFARWLHDVHNALYHIWENFSERVLEEQNPDD